MFINTHYKMVKKLPLTKRLQIALSNTDSEEERQVIYGLLYKLARKSVL